MRAAHLQRKRNGNAAVLTGQPGVPPLRNGDHLTAPEFEKRYALLPDTRAELIEGIVVMGSPVSERHASAQSTMTFLLKRYSLATPGLSCAANASVRLDNKNEYQPDVLLRFESGRLARSKVAADGFLAGAPEFVAEIAMSSAAYDLHEKKLVYQRHLVPEYFVWEIMEEQIHWFVLENREYIEAEPDGQGVLRSRVFPGLWLEVPALLAGDANKAASILEMGLESAEHKKFLKKLAQRSRQE